jgi:thiol-disulfide isomerase/thioredoxin
MRHIILILLVTFLNGCYSKRPKVITGLEGKPMPAIESLCADSITHLNTQNIPYGKPTLLISFEPWCPFCKAQTKSILANIKSLENLNIYMFCHGRFNDFKKFYDDYNLKDYPTIKAGIDIRYQMVGYFKSTNIPYLAIYNKNKLLSEVFEGKTSVVKIRRVALEK